MALRQQTQSLLSRRLWSAGANIFFLSRTPLPPTATAASMANSSDNIIISSSSSSSRSSSGSSSGSEIDVQVQQASGKPVLEGEAGDRIARAAAAVDAQALRGGFVPSDNDVRVESATRFGGPGAAAMNSMVEAVYGMFAGNSKVVERSVESLSRGTAGVSHRPVTTRWARATVSASSSSQEDADEAAAIRATLAAYRFAGMVPKAVTPEPEAPAKQQAKAKSAQQAADQRPAT